MANPEGESENKPLRLVFDRRLKLEFYGSRITLTLVCLLPRTRRCACSGEQR